MKEGSLSYATGVKTGQLLETTIGKLFDQIVEQHPGNLALVVRHQNVRWSYQEYQHEVNRLALGLLALGIGKHDRVGIWAPNCYQWCMTQFATAKIGAILVCINPAYRPNELQYVLNKVACRVLITAEKFKGSDYLNMLTQLAPELNRCKPGKLVLEKLPHLTNIIKLGEQLRAGMWNFDQILNSGDGEDQSLLAKISDELSPDDAINIQFTSGTTGGPKGATLSHRNILNNGAHIGAAMGLTKDDKLCIPVPLYHCFGMVLGNLACISRGATAVFPDASFDPLSTLQTIEDETCTAMHGVPTMFIAVLDHPQFDNFNLSSLRTGIMAGAPCPVDVMNRVISKMHMNEVLIAYGQTETSPINHITSVDDPIEKRVGTVGRAAPHLEIKLIDEFGSTVSIGQQGEICCRGYAVMQNYWQDDVKTKETIDEDGWLHSGDIGVMDGEGYVQITGRIKDLIIRGGENIYPREIEEFLFTHPLIQEVHVFGIPDDTYGEQVCAWIKLRSGELSTAADIQRFCKDQIAHFKIPHHIRFVDEYPMTVTGKVQKFVMREQMESLLVNSKLATDEDVL